MINYKGIIELLALVCTAISAILGVIAYKKQQKINQVQNLIDVFRRFAENSEFAKIFELCDRENTDELKEFSSPAKYRYLALLEEVAVLSKNSGVIREDAIHLFQFHFYYVYGDNRVSSAFWNNVGSGAGEKDKEGWEYQREFAKNATHNIKKA